MPDFIDLGPKEDHPDKLNWIVEHGIDSKYLIGANEVLLIVAKINELYSIRGKFIDVTSSRLLNQNDHNTTLKIKSNVTITIPASGISEEFICHFDVYPGCTLLIATASGISVSGNSTMSVQSDQMCLLYRDNLNHYRLRGNV